MVWRMSGLARPKRKEDMPPQHLCPLFLFTSNSAFYLATPQQHNMATLFTWAEIAKHTTKEDLWIVVDNKVYDVTAFGDDHPGGVEVILETAGMCNSVLTHI